VKLFIVYKRNIIYNESILEATIGDIESTLNERCTFKFKKKVNSEQILISVWSQRDCK
jgi:hypothetical protein